MKRKVKPLDLPSATPEQWESAFRHMEEVFAANKSRRWVLQVFRDRLADIAGSGDAPSQAS